MRISERARQDRTERGMDRGTYASAVLGRPASYINTHRWEREREIRPSQILALARWLGLTPTDVLEEVAAQFDLPIDETRAIAQDPERWKRHARVRGWIVPPCQPDEVRGAHEELRLMAVLG